MMQESKVDVAKKVLDYWYIMEFLSQENWPRWKEKDLRKAKNANIEEQKRQNAVKMGLKYEPPEYPAKVLKMCCELKPGQDIYEFVRQSAEEHGMTRWGNITVYAGKIERELCINKIAESIKSLDERPERNSDKIAWASLQVAPDGTYIEKSFSLSPVVWAVGQIAGVENVISMSEVLDLEIYKREQNEYDKIFFSFEREGKRGEKRNTEDEVGDVDEKKYELDETGRYIKKAEYALSKEQILKQMSQIYKAYIAQKMWRELDKQWNGVPADEKIVVCLSYNLFRGENEREIYGDEEYMGLSKTYFSADIDMIRNRVETFEKSENPMEQELLDYIYSGYEEYYEEKGVRVDLLRKRERDIEGKLFKKLYLDILNVVKAPQGKWPSRFMPAFMQQVAINLATEGMGYIFSVNGPPGTGKTTMLKEIIVHNVVERAKLLAEYSDPADAFEMREFENGTKECGAYFKYAQHYYILKNNHINDYSVLVASCNNAAVENITKELPLEQGILDNLKSKDDDSIAMKDELWEIAQLFTVDKNEEAEWLREADFSKKEKQVKKCQIEQNKWETDCHDIYFTRYARNLSKRGDAWGLVAAPLGRKKNIREFYQRVMKPLEYVLVGGTEDERKKRRLNEYRNIREKFQKQLEVVKAYQNPQEYVCNMEKNIKENCDTLTEEKRQLEECQLALEGEKANKKYATKDLKERLQRIEGENEISEQRIHEIDKRCQEMQSECDYMKQRYRQNMEEIVKKDESLKWIDKFFKTQRAQDVRKLQEIYRSESMELEQKREKIERDISDYMRERQEIEEELNINVKEQGEWLAELCAKEGRYDYQIHKLEEKIAVHEKNIEKCRNELKKYQDFYRRNDSTFADRDDTEKFVWLDDDFMKDFLSNDKEKSTRAQVSNPWFNEKYNREREKLFYYAMKLHEAFILASQACRENLINLGLLWKLRNDEDNKRVVFSEVDRKAAIEPLLQTLFLLVPVISTTFASVRSFLGDAGATTVGTLIVDEAGQASPQMAVGALYRSRKAVIVGDPRQIEPVVTDELRLIRQAYNEKLYKPYIRKNVSVQHFADYLNPYGTFFHDQAGYKEWVGCPLVVHRRCISPMYDISNNMSYNGIMKQQTGLPSKEKEKMFCYPVSCWIHVKGNERGKKDHFVPEQGKQVMDVLRKAFEKNDYPDIYVISPFKTVVEGMKEVLNDYCKLLKKAEPKKAECIKRWSEKQIGTVHTFQGKEADEVIFLLGCDASDESEGAIKWVNSNIVNVAVTRAKYRLYIIGDEDAWEKSDYIREAKMLMK